MLHIALDDLEESHISQLCDAQTPEGLRLEFKEALDVSKIPSKREIAKDVSAMANSDGGRIVYGIAEETRQEGSKVAGRVSPLRDGSIVDIFENIVVTTIQPRPRFRIRKIPVTGGFVLVIEVYSSYGSDLHMATGYSEDRFYRRGEQRSILMTEPEIREAYARIAIKTGELDEQIRKSVSGELETRSSAQESIVLAPWYARRNLADPRMLENIGSKLASGPFGEFDSGSDISNIRIFAGGMRALVGGSVASQAEWYLLIGRNGVVHFSQKNIIYADNLGRHSYLFPDTLKNLLATLMAASLIYDLVSYWGPVRVIHRLHFPADCSLSKFGGLMPAGHHQGIVDQVNLREIGSDREPVVRELMDQLFQRMGYIRCSWFDESGHLLGNRRADIGWSA